MSKLWVFSDSYGFLPADRYHEWKDKHWYRLLSDKLGCTEDFKSIAHNGCANEWISFQIEKNFDDIDENDYVVVVATDKDREWFFPNDVGISNIYMHNVGNHISRNHAVAIDYYKHFLKNNYQSDIRFNWYINYIKYKFSNHKLIILPGFENNLTVFNDKFSTKGTLFEICQLEINQIKHRSWENWLQNNRHIDPRVGHLSYCNHQVLSDKLYNSFKRVENLDLTSGFHKEFL